MDSQSRQCVKFKRRYPQDRFGFRNRFKREAPAELRHLSPTGQKVINATRRKLGGRLEIPKRMILKNKIVGFHLRLEHMLTLAPASVIGHESNDSGSNHVKIKKLIMIQFNGQYPKEITHRKSGLIPLTFSAPLDFISSILRIKPPGSLVDIVNGKLRHLKISGLALNGT